MVEIDARDIRTHDKRSKLMKETQNIAQNLKKVTDTKIMALTTHL
jgi:hypothetical protein